MNRNYASISPSAGALLLMKSLTEIPFSADVARLFFNDEALQVTAAKLSDQLFVKRLLHFEQRYWSVDELLNTMGSKNIMEISSGFSFRMLDRALHNEDVTCIDTDLPQLIKTKKQITGQLLDKLQLKFPPNLTVKPLNVLDEKAFINTIKQFKPGPITIVNEGLLVYLNDDEKVRLCGIIRELLSRHGGCWITADIYVKSDALKSINDAVSAFLKKHNVEENKFANFEDAREFFEDQGFVISKRVGSVKNKLSALKYLEVSDQDKEQIKAGARIRETWVLTVK